MQQAVPNVTQTASSLTEKLLPQYRIICANVWKGISMLKTNKNAKNATKCAKPVKIPKTIVYNVTLTWTDI